MSFKLMYITNDVETAKIAQNNGVDWIFIDLEINGKLDRQGHLDTVISKHQISDIRPIKEIITVSEVLVRINPIFDESKREVEKVIDSGADIVMLPFFRTPEEVEKFITYVDSRAKTCLLLETIDSVKNLEDILKIPGIDYIHIGLNDLHLELNKKFMFELLLDGTVEDIIKKIKKTNIKYGFGGIASLGRGDLNSETIITEHIRLGSTMTILSRTFCPHDSSEEETDRIFNIEVKKIRNYFNQELKKSIDYLSENKNEMDNKITHILSRIKD